MNDGNTRREWARWSLRWFVAADMQAQRSRDTDSLGDRETELLMFVAALRNALRGAERVLGKGSHRLRDFKQSAPTLVKVRDMIEHHDEYIAGTGNLQQTGREQLPWRTALSGAGDSHTFSIWYGNVGEDTETLDVDVDGSLVAAAALVRAALQAAGITAVSPVLERYL